MTDLIFTSWQRSGLYDLVADPTPHGGRLVGRLQLDLSDRRGPDVATGGVPFHLVAARDVAALGPRAILRTAPPHLARDAETTKLVHVEFREPDLPWRYAPAKAAGDRLPPWLVVLVGTVAELRVDGPAVAVLQPSVLAAHDLADSPRWAHVQDGRTSRLLSPRRLDPQTEYVAVLVPAFDDAGQPAWAAGRSPATLPVLHSWRFWTGEEGDFETLAFQITPRAVAGLGRAPLAYDRGAVHADLSVRGAITTLGIDPDGEPEALARTDLAALVAQVRALTDPLGRGIVALPDYGRPWVDPATAVWTGTLNADPRYRGTAGLGLWMGLEAQDELVDAATRQLGALGLAGHLVGQLALGLTAARSLWDRRLSADPARRLDVLSPLLRRMRTPTGTAMGAVSGPAGPLEPALFSSASRRLLRRGSAWTRHGATGYAARPAVLAEANRCPSPADRPAGLPHLDGIARDLGLPPLAELDGRIVQDPPWVDPDHLLDPGDLISFLDPILPRGERPPCAPPDLDRVGAVVAAAVDPHGPLPPAVRRVRDRISGIDLGDLGPPEVPVGLDLPTWTLLRDRAKEWILPGIGTLEKHSVVAMQTNPTFIDAYLVGLNTQLQNELHWRNLPIDRRATPLLMFWGHVDFATGRREAEIRPLDTWDLGTDLGDLDHQVLQPGDTTGKRDLVLVFRTDLFRRYPRTLVYLVKPTPSADDALLATPQFSYAPADKANRRFLGPIFQGALAPDVVFFAFDVDPSTLDQYWVVLDEPPSELRFRAVDAAGNPLGGAAPAAAAFARATIDKPTRVGIEGGYLEQLGLRL